MLSTKTLDKITVKELCERADINRSTFYLHYTSIQDLYQSLVDSLYREVRRSLEEFVEKDRGWLDMLVQEGAIELPILRHILYFLYENQEMIRVLIAGDEHGDFLRPFYERGKESVMRALQEDGAKIPLSVASYYYDFAASGVIGVIVRWLENGMKETPDEIVFLLENLIADGAKGIGGSLTRWNT